MEQGSQFNIRKPIYLKTFEFFKDPTSFNQIADVMRKHLRGKNNSPRCLDAMAATGHVGRKMKEIFPEINVVYQDKSQKMLSSDEYLEDSGRILSDGAALPVSDKSFDIVCCRMGLNNVAEVNYPKILKEYLRVLNDDGVVILQDHFARTGEEQKVINALETEVSIMEGIKDETYVPTLQGLRKLIQEIGGKVASEESFEAPFSAKQRFFSKGIEQPNLLKIKKILEAQSAIKYEYKEEDIIIVYPISTIAFKKAM